MYCPFFCLLVFETGKPASADLKLNVKQACEFWPLLTPVVKNAPSDMDASHPVS